MDTFLSLISLSSSSSITHSSVLFLPKYTPQEGGFSLQFYQHFGEVSPPHPYAQEAAGISAFVTSMAAKETGRQSNYIIPKTLTSIIYRTTRTHTLHQAPQFTTAITMIHQIYAQGMHYSLGFILQLLQHGILSPLQCSRYEMKHFPFIPLMPLFEYH